MQSVTNFEGTELSGPLLAARFNVLDMCYRRPLLKHFLELGDLAGGALRDEMYRAVSVISDPTLQTQLARPRKREVTETNALNVAVNSRRESFESGHRHRKTKRGEMPSTEFQPTTPPGLHEPDGAETVRRIRQRPVPPMPYRELNYAVVVASNNPRLSAQRRNSVTSCSKESSTKSVSCRL